MGLIIPWSQVRILPGPWRPGRPGGRPERRRSVVVQGADRPLEVESGPGDVNAVHPGPGRMGHAGHVRRAVADGAVAADLAPGRGRARHLEGEAVVHRIVAAVEHLDAEVAAAAEVVAD